MRGTLPDSAPVTKRDHSGRDATDGTHTQQIQYIKLISSVVCPTQAIRHNIQKKEKKRTKSEEDRKRTQTNRTLGLAQDTAIRMYVHLMPLPPPTRRIFSIAC